MKFRRLDSNRMMMLQHEKVPAFLTTRSAPNPEHRTSFVYARSRVSNTANHDRAPRVPVRTRIGIVSHPQHRDPLRWTSIRAQMKSVLAKHGGREAEAVTLLAAATDRLFATVAREHGMRLSVVIPCQNFQNFFDTPDDLSEYVHLRALAQSRTILDHAAFDRKAFDDASKFVVDTCDLLVVVGSGKKALPHVETGSIVQYASEKGKPLVWLDPDTAEMTRRMYLLP
jgi:hypothetical protein